MIHGENKPSGHFSTIDANGNRVEGETYQCIHCQHIWIPQPGSGIRRGYCNKHQGMLCGRQECINQQKLWTGTSHDCITILEYNDRIRDHVEKHHRLDKGGPKVEVATDGKIVADEGFGNFKTTSGGLIIPS